jgi:hypothetical protein
MNTAAKITPTETAGWAADRRASAATASTGHNAR